MPALSLATLSMLPELVSPCLGGALRAHRRNVWLMVASAAADVVALAPQSWLLGIHLGLGLASGYIAWPAFALANLGLVLARGSALALEEAVDPAAHDDVRDWPVGAAAAVLPAHTCHPAARTVSDARRVTA